VKHLPTSYRGLAAVLLTAFAAVTVAAATRTAQAPAYPPAPRGDHVDDYHGVKVADPYRWMEDIDSPRTRAWVKAESELSSRYLAAIPDRNAIAQRLQQIWNFERWSPPQKHGKYWFYSHNDGLQNQSVIFVTTDPASPAHVLLDPNTMRTKMRAEAMPGEDPLTLKTPEDLAPHIVKLALPSWDQTGKIYDFTQDGKVIEPQMPA